MKTGTKPKLPLERSGLRAVKDWSILAYEARYHPKRLAELCDVSLRELERFFVAEMGQRPREWLRVQRLQQATQMPASERRTVGEP